jgi:hypothetical protein
MSKGNYDIFALVVNFLNVNWQPKQKTIGLFVTTETIRQALAVNLNNLLNSFGLRKKIIAFVKDEGAFLNVVTSKGMLFVMIFWGWRKVSTEVALDMFFSKACQYGIIEEFFCKDMRFVSI